MKNIFLGFMLAGAFTANAQVKKPVAKSVPSKPASTVNVLKNLTDSASYAIGLSVANFYAQQGIKSLNTAIISKAINDAFAKKSLLLNEQQSNMVMMKLINQMQQAKAKPTIEAGEKFLAQNKTKAGVKTTPSGLQYEVITEGKGPKPTVNDSVTVNYVGSLLDGTEFDNSYKRGEPITFPVGGVIRGWTEALQLMPQGSKYKLYIPQQLAYGTNEVGNIPAGSLLIFEVELLNVAGKDSTPKASE